MSDIRDLVKAYIDSGDLEGTADAIVERELSTTARESVPKRQFLMPDAPGGPKYPVHDRSHLANARARLQQNRGQYPAATWQKAWDRSEKLAKQKHMGDYSED